MTGDEATVVRRQVVVNAPIASAFAAFTERFGDFKPPEHNLLGAPIAERHCCVDSGRAALNRILSRFGFRWFGRVR